MVSLNHYINFIKNSTLIQGYSGFRPDILALIEYSPKNVLDVGCGAGLLAKEIKRRYPGALVTGLEQDEALAKEAQKYCDTVITMDIDRNNLSCVNGHYDLIVLADIIEHIVSPAKALKNLCNHLEDEGVIITSIPNVRHYSTFISLYIFGIWPQRDRGIHDKTHLHFFTKKNISDLLDEAGLKIVKEKRNVRLIESLSWTNIPGKLFDFWPLRGFFTFQYLHCAIKKPQ